MRRVVALASGLVLSTLLLGGGWLFSTYRERETRMREARAHLSRVAEGVRAAVDESLEELRAREDERPFYLYSHFYSPPDVLAISDPVAVSPLAHPPTDPRIVGYFQIEPGGGVRTPYTADPGDTPHPLSARLRSLLAESAFEDLRALSSQLVEPLAAPSGARDPGEGSLLTLSVGDVPEAPVPDEARVDLNEWGNVQAQDIVMAQAGDPYANMRVIDRGRQVPRMHRRNVSWREAEEQAQSQRVRQRSAPRLPRRPLTAEVRSRLEERRSAVLACQEDEVTVRLRIRGSDGTPIGVTVSGTESQEARRCVSQALSSVRFAPFLAETLVIGFRYRRVPSRTNRPELADTTGLDNMVQRETEVDYTPMAFRRFESRLVLHRIVSHEGVSAVQGVLLDRARILSEWIPQLVERHAPAEARPSVVPVGEGGCAARFAASATVDVADLCFATHALDASVADLNQELGWQVAALLVLLATALLAAFAIVSAARRAEALSRQKSAFVSAVSHELRTPLTTVRMHAEMLEEGLVTEDRRPKVHRELVRESVRLARLVDNVLSLSKLEEGRRRLNRSEGDLRAHVREVVEGQRRFVQERGFTIEGPPAGSPVDAVFDRQAIEQIVVNLIDNAVKYGSGESKDIEVRVERSGADASIVVRDRGPGIPEAERERVFERFHRVDREEHAHAPGTGIGLALVAELAEAHGGGASVHPRDGGGLEVRVRLG